MPHRSLQRCALKWLPGKDTEGSAEAQLRHCPQYFRNQTLPEPTQWPACQLGTVSAVRPRAAISPPSPIGTVSVGCSSLLNYISAGPSCHHEARHLQEQSSS